MKTKIIEPLIAEMLAELEKVFTKFGIDFYLVGAVARDIHLSASEDLASVRRTKDVDLAIAISDEGQYNQVKEALLSTELFKAHKIETIKLFYKSTLELDLIPFGEIELPNRTVKLTNPTFVLNMPGFAEIYPFVEKIELGTGQKVKVCSMEGLVLLKLVANNDRPERTKDITDIEHIINCYFDLYQDDVYGEYFEIFYLYEMEVYEYIQIICSRIIGRKMKILLEASPELFKRITNILAKRETPRWEAMLAGMTDKIA